MVEFGTGGFRGIIADTFTKGNIRLIAQAIADIAREDRSRKPIVIGYDYRFLSEQAALWIAEVFAGNGIQTLLSEEATPSPTIMFVTKSERLDFGVMVTASHNPALFNGVKAFQRDGMDADVALTGRIEARIAKIKKIKRISRHDERFPLFVKRRSFLKPYTDHIRSFMLSDIDGSDLRILFDAFHGTGARTFGRIARELHLSNFRILHRKRDALFGGLVPNPTKENMMRDRKYLATYPHDVTFGMDCDGDRLGVLDEKGDYVDSNEIFAALYYYLVKFRGQKGDCVKNCATSDLLDHLAEKMGFKCHEVAVGFKNISSKLRETDALIGGESSGGLTVRNYLYGKDATFASCLFMEMIIRMKKPISEIIEEVKDYAEFHSVIREAGFSYEEGSDIHAYINTHVPSFEKLPTSVEKYGKNVKYRFEKGGWVLLRLSGTEPVLRVFVEMEEEEEVQRYLDVVMEFIRDMNMCLAG